MTADVTQKGQAPSHMWGSSGEILLNAANFAKSSVQLAQVALPRPAVCSLYLQASFLEDQAPLGYVQQLIVELYTGVGRITVPRTLVFNNQPSPLSPLEFTLPFVPMHALQAQVSAIGVNVGGGQFLRLMVQLLLSPISHIPQDAEPLLFGMAVPGEADQMDDSLRANLEEHAPDVADIMNAREGTNPEDPDTYDDDEGDDDDDDERVAGARRVQVPREWQRKIDRLSARLGRTATMRDLAPSERKRLLRAMGGF